MKAQGGDAAGSHPLHAEPADRDAGQRYRHDAGASPEPRDRAGFSSDDGPPAPGAAAACRADSRDGRFELYKISAAFDGNESRRQHGLPLMDELTA